MQLSSTLIITLLSAASFGQTRSTHHHSRALRARAFEDGYRSGLMARWAFPDPAGLGLPGLDNGMGLGSLLGTSEDKCHREKVIDPHRTCLVPPLGIY